MEIQEHQKDSNPYSRSQEKKAMSTCSPCVGVDGGVKGNSQKAGRYRESSALPQSLSFQRGDAAFKPLLSPLQTVLLLCSLHGC